MSKLSEQVREFHAQFGVERPSKPTIPDAGRIQLRLKLIMEEALELLAACGCPVESIGLDELVRESIAGQGATGELDLVEVTDALGDIDYVVQGTRDEFGIDGDPIAAEIHRSNMAKLGGGKNEAGKFLKPPGWTAPDIAGELAKQGWVP